MCGVRSDFLFGNFKTSFHEKFGYGLGFVKLRITPGIGWIFGMFSLMQIVQDLLNSVSGRHEVTNHLAGL